MRKYPILLFLFCITLAFEASARQSRFYSDAALDELRLELSDVKHELHSARVEINLLEEKLSKQERALSLKGQDENKIQTSNLETLNKKIDRLEKILDKALIDVRHLNSNDNKVIVKMQELENNIVLQEKKFEEIGKLKNTLTALSKAIGHSIKASTARMHQIYQVKAGDSLEKIARTHNTTVDDIKQLNQLASDKIVIGQELTIYPHENK